MGFLEYISRYRAARPHPTLRLEIIIACQLNLRHQYYLRQLFMFLFILTIATASLITVHANAISIQKQNVFTSSSQPPSEDLWPSINIGRKIDNMVADNTDGTVYVAANDDIYKYSRNLTLLFDTRQSSNSTGSSASSPPKYTTSSQHVDIRNKILMISKKPNLETLLSCWQTNNLNLGCLMYRLRDMKASILPWSSTDKNKGFKIEPNEHFLSLNGRNDDHLLLVTRRTLPLVKNQHYLTDTSHSAFNTNASYQPMPAMGRFKLGTVRNPPSLFLELKSVLPYRSQMDNYDLYYDYVYLFEHNDYTHFILNDIRKHISGNKHSPSTFSDPTTTHHSVRIARICNNDTDFNSYTELSLTCNNRFNIYAKAAHLDTSKPGNPQLFIAFEILEDGVIGARRTVPKSCICSYSMKLIEDLFYNAISECNNARDVAHLLGKLHPEVDRPPICQKNPSKDWCLSKTNPFVDGISSERIVREDSFSDFTGMAAINFLFTTTQGTSEKDVHFVGTETGLLTKMSTDEDFFYTIDLTNSIVKPHLIGSERLSQSFATNETLSLPGYYYPDQVRYIVNSREIVAATNLGIIHRLNMDSCKFYTSCRACLTIQDPLNCVWCDRGCQQRSECSTKEVLTSTCPPLIKSFTPSSGPLTGSTKITITGENFGSLQNTANRILEVKLGDVDCNPDLKLSFDERIICYTKPVDRRTEAKINVRVHDEYGYIYVNGTSQSRIPYIFDDIELYELSPSNGSMISETKITLTGKNLDVGSNRSLIIGETECFIVELRQDIIGCLYKPQQVEDATVRELNLTVKFLVDGFEQPTRSRSTKDGSIPMMFTLRSDATQTADFVTDIPLDGSAENSSTWSGILLSLTIIVVIVFALFYLSRSTSLSQFKIKIPHISSPTRNNDNEEAKVSFRNPESHKFINSNQNNVRHGESLNGLVKLNGSIMSSDYFGKTMTLEQLDQDKPLITSFVDNELLAILGQEKILIERNRLTLGHVLGHGQFGRVYKGFLKIDGSGEHTAVAVKTILMRSSLDDSVDNRAFLEEGLMMRDFDHENVLALIGVTFDSNGLPMVITPFMLYGDLRTYISDEASSPTVKELIEYGTQVAKGMAYLSGLKFVHRDLAARNCMLDENLTVKVADFGLSRDIYERDYYSSDNKKAKLPVKWMAIESLEKSVYSTKTDVWSYGVLLWELMTRGVVPYPDVDNFDLFSYLKEGRRMLRPRYCPVILYNIMLSCWHENPTLRPTFEELVESVSNVITKLQDAKDNGEAQQKVSRDETYCDVLK